MPTKKNETKVSTHNIVSSEEFANLIKTNCLAIINDPSKAKMLPPVMCWGSPGVGKSSIVRSVAEELNIDFIDVRLAQMEPCDIKGLPVPNKENKTMDWFVNGSWPTDPKSKGILFLDELSSCDRSIAVAAYELILDRRLGKLYQVPDGWYIVGAGNLTTDRAVASTMSSALANRFMHVEIEADPEQWVTWAQMHDIHPSVTGFIQYRPMNLFNMEGENLERGWPSPRSWDRVSQMVKLYSGDEHLLRKIVYGLVGPAKGVEFMEFHKLNKSFDSVLDMMYGRIPVRIPERNDEKYALCSTLIYVLWRNQNEKDPKDEEKRIDGFFKIITAMTSDFSSMCMVGAMNGKSKADSANCAKKLFYNKHYKEWSEKHGKALRKRISL